MKYEHGLWWPDTESHLNNPNPLSYQKSIRDFAVGLIPQHKRKLCVDVGAHVGIATIDFASQFSEVTAFEPIQETYECLKKNVEERKLWNVSLYNSGISHEDGLMVGFIVHEGNTGYTEPVIVDVPFGPILKPTMTLDTVLNGAKPDLIKVDVEGFEPLVVKGALKTINKCKPVIILEQKGIGFSKADPHAAVRTLIEAGYKVVGQESHDVVLAHADKFPHKGD